MHASGRCEEETEKEIECTNAKHLQFRDNVLQVATADFLVDQLDHLSSDGFNLKEIVGERERKYHSRKRRVVTKKLDLKPGRTTSLNRRRIGGQADQKFK